MANAIKKISVQRGYDVTKYALASFGGAGGQHACLVADALGMKTVIVHPFAGVLSAYGMGLADIRAHPGGSSAGLEVSKQAEQRLSGARRKRRKSRGRVAGPGHRRSPHPDRDPRTSALRRAPIRRSRYPSSTTPRRFAAFEAAHKARSASSRPVATIVFDMLEVEAIGADAGAPPCAPRTGEAPSTGRGHPGGRRRWHDADLRPATTCPRHDGRRPCAIVEAPAPP
jgi:5-oxoprolinase (ATP-hydrolysing)